MIAPPSKDEKYEKGDLILYKGRKLLIARILEKTPVFNTPLLWCKILDGEQITVGLKDITAIAATEVERHLNNAEVVELKLRGLV